MREGASSRERGFSLIELLIVVTVILIIASIAVPSLQSSRKAAFEASAIAYMRTWTSGQELYFMRHGHYADADQQLVNEGFIGNPDPDRMGYIFSIDNPRSFTDAWWGTAVPRTPGVTGDRYFYIDSSGVIRFENGGMAGPGSPPLGSSPGP